jgi:HEAT repeat protein
MKRNKIILISVLICLAILLFIFLPEAPERGEPAQPVFFSRTVKLISPPPHIVQKGTGSRILRFIDRLEWGTTRAVNRAIGVLVESGNPVVVSEAIKKIELHRRERPSRAKVYIDLLAELSVPESLPVLLSCSQDSTEMIRLAALRGLSGFVSQESTAMLVEQARAGSEKVRLACLENLVTRDTPEVFALYRDLIEEDEDLNVTKIAVDGLGGFDTPESRELLMRCRADTRLFIRTAALGASLRLGDPEADRILEGMLTHEGPIRRLNGIKLLAQARRLPSLDLLQTLAVDPDYDVRVYMTIALISHVTKDQGEQRQKARAALETLLADESPQVRMKALEGLYKVGFKSAALPYLRKLSDARGHELNEAVEIAANLLCCPEAKEILETRFVRDRNLTGDERLAIMTGLTEVGDSGSAELFFRVMEGEWDARRIRIGEFSLDRLASFRVHAFGEEIYDRWVEFLDDDGSDRATFLFINSMRNLGSPRAAERLLSIAGDEGRPQWIRMEAVRSFVFLEDLSLGERLLEFHRKCSDREVSALAFKVFWNYF